MENLIQIQLILMREDPFVKQHVVQDLHVEPPHVAQDLHGEQLLVAQDLLVVLQKQSALVIIQ